MDAKTRTVWIDGRFLDSGGDGAGVSVLDHGVLYGDGVFEGIRFYGGAPFRLGPHLDRLARSAAALALALPPAPELRAAVDAVIARSGRADGYLRLVVTRGAGALGLDPASCPRPTVFIVATQLALYAGAAARGLDAVIVSVRQPGPDVLDPRIKSLNYLPRVLARVEAVRAGADEAILLNPQGRVTEASTENIFAVSRGALRTPPAVDGALEGVTRAVVLELAAAAGIPACVESLTPYDLYSADELFLTGTAAEMVPLRRVDGRAPTLPCPGPTFTLLAQAFRRLVARESAAATALRARADEVTAAGA
jgi:branched-chain amino acid aminotransferase